MRLEDLSDAELEAEIERRQLDREMDERAARASAQRAAPAWTRTPQLERRRGRRSAPAIPVAKAYAALEVPPGSDFETVRKAYRT